MTYRPRSLSYSQIELYSRCPAAWERRYVHGVKDVSAPLTFGSCFASALEAEHRGDDGDVHWVRAYAAEQMAGNLPPGSPTIEMGLRLLARYRERGVLTGRPEVRWSEYLPNRDLVPVPIVGVFDLVSELEVAEFKTGQTLWDQGRCDSSLQGQLYAFAFHRLTGRKPHRVRWLCFHTGRGALSEFESYPASGEMQLIELQAAAVWRGIRDQQFPAMCRKPYCAACVDAGVVPVKTPKAGMELVL